MRSFKKSAKRLRDISTLSEVGGVSLGFLSVWLAAEPITGTVAVAGGIAISHLVRRAAEDREKRGADQDMRIANDATEAFQAHLMREIQSIKSSLNYVVLALAALVIAYSLRSVSFLDWQTYLIGFTAILAFFYLAPGWREPDSVVGNEDSSLTIRDHKSPDHTVQPKRQWWKFWGKGS